MKGVFRAGMIRAAIIARACSPSEAGGVYRRRGGGACRKSFLQVATLP